MNYIFFGTPDFAAIILDNLIKAGLPPTALVCNPDRPVGRKKIITEPPTKQIASKYKAADIKVLQPEKIDDLFLNTLRDLNADFYIVAAYGKILKRALLDIPPLGTIGVHPSLLPKYRGASPIQSAILNREDETGVDLFMIDEKIDNGPVLLTKKLAVQNKGYKELEKELAELAGAMLVEALPKFVTGQIVPVPQDDGQATFTKKFMTDDGFVAYEDLLKAQTNDRTLAATIEAKIRALSSEPGVYTVKDDRRIKLLEARLGDELLRLVKIQPESKNPINFSGVL